MTGAKNVITLHGTVYKNHCVDCNKEYDLDYVLRFKNDIPKCECGGIIKPNVVLYEEPLDNDDMTTAIANILECDTLIVGGTSLNVYPAAGLIRYFNGKNLIIINKDATSYDDLATLVIREPIGKVFKQIKVK